MTDEANKVAAALRTQGFEVLGAKGGGFYVRGEGFVSMAQARKRTGIAAPKRAPSVRQAAWGDYATIAAIAGRFNG
jgi:hypothetical protein